MVVAILTHPAGLGFATEEPLEFLGAVTQGLGGAGRAMTPRQQPRSLRPSPRPHDLQWLEKGVLKYPLLPQLVRTPSQARVGNRVRGRKEGHARRVRKTPSPGTRRTPHSSHRHWAPPYWTTTRPPPRANHREAKVSAAPPNKKY